MLKSLISSIHDCIHLPYPIRQLKKNKSIVEARLQKYFENTPWHSFELDSLNMYPQITSINNQKVPLRFFSTSLVKNTEEHVKNLIAYHEGDPDSFLLSYNLKESELMSLYNKFNDNLTKQIGTMFYTRDSIIKYENGKLSYHFKNIII